MSVTIAHHHPEPKETRLPLLTNRTCPCPALGQDLPRRDAERLGMPIKHLLSGSDHPATELAA